MSLPPLKHIESQDPKLTPLRKRFERNLLIMALVAIIATVTLGVIGLIGGIFAGLMLIVTLQFQLFQKNQVENFYHYRELEALLGLYQLITPRIPLPPMRLWVLSPDSGVMIATLIQEHQPDLVVELGGGTSTLISAYSLEKVEKGRVIAFDHLKQFADETAFNLKRHKLDEIAESRHSELVSHTIKDEVFNWYDLQEFEDVANINLLIVDGPPEGTNRFARFPAIPMLFDRLAPGALILVDDYLRQDEYKMVNRWIDDYGLELIERHANEKGVAVLRKPIPRPID